MLKDTNSIVIQGACEHNLRSVDVVIPKSSLVVFSGVSGSGKSSLAFDTIYVEGQRKYIESLSSYARQFLGQLERPKYEKITGLAPTIAIEQKAQSSNPRSTVGTVTEILDYLRVVFARAGDQRCPGCGRSVGKQDPQQIVQSLAGLPNEATIIVMAPIVRDRKGEFKVLIEDYMKQGFVRFRIDGEILRLDQSANLDKKKKHDIDVVIDRLKIRPDMTSRLTDTVETALRVGKGHMLVTTGEAEELRFSEDLFCDFCGISLPDLSPQLFSFNSPLGACPECHGIGISVELDAAKVLTSPHGSVFENLKKVTAIWKGRRRGWERGFYAAIQKAFGVTPGTRIAALDSSEQHRLLFGDEPETTSGFPGLWGMVSRDLALTQSELVKAYYDRFLKSKRCSSCDGTRLRAEARSVLLGSRSLPELSALTVEELEHYLSSMDLGEHRNLIAAEPVREVVGRLAFLRDVGLEYLTLDRTAHTLSGGEAQRIRLARQLGSELSGVIYILDEPSVGLHPRDSLRLVRTLLRLRDLGNTVIVVEHDSETMRAADHIVDFGPGAGRFGGHVIHSGNLPELLANEQSLTGQYLSSALEIPIPVRRQPSDDWVEIDDINIHNLVHLNVRIPTGCFVVVTGVSGAGKSTLVEEVVRPAIEAHISGEELEGPAIFGELRGASFFDAVVTVDQKPIGRTPRSNPATYTKLLDSIRTLFSNTADARAYGYSPSRFSFNVKGGRCERCEGDGSLKIEMHFLPDVYVPCPQCKGQRFNDATLRVLYKGKNIADVLGMTVEEALDFFKNITTTKRILQTLMDVGLSYMQLGQPSTTLSGGEAQRIKLSKELSRANKGHTLYILDEPTTGLHFHDISRLLGVIHRLVDAGNTVLMVEHNVEIIKSADWVVDMGPEGGAKGGRIVAAGTPEDVVASPESITGQHLAQALKKST